MLTIFAIPKPFVGHIGIIQRNAIKSWLSLGEQVEILLLGDEVGIQEIAAEFNLAHLPGLKRNRFNTPTVSSAFDIAQKAAKGSFMAYVNGDIILTRDFLKVPGSIPFKKFLISGQRLNLEVTEELDFISPDWERELVQQAATSGKRIGPAAMDCFIFPKGMYRHLPPFGIGRAGWDNWIVYWARSHKIPVIDATQALTLIHQNHDYAHHPQGLDGVYFGEERDSNIELAGGWEHIFTLDDANWLLTPGGLKRPPLTGSSLLNRMRRLPSLHPLTTPLVKLLFGAAKICQKVGRRAEGYLRRLLKSTPEA